MTRVAIADSNGLATARGAAYRGASTKKHVVRRFDNATGLTLTGGATAEVVTYKGGTWLKVTGVANTQFEVQLTSFSLPAPVGPHVVTVYALEDYTKVSSVVQFFGSSGYSAWLQTTNTISGAFGRNGIAIIENNASNTSVNGSGFTRNTGTAADAKIRVVPVAGQVGVIYLHSMFLMANIKANVVLGFDDNRPGINQTAAASVTLRGVAGSYTFKDILDAYGYKGTLWVVSGYMNGDADPGTDSTLTWAQIASLVADGWDVQVQTHYNPGDASSAAGSTLLGPTGYAAKSLASVSNAANAFTASTTHNIYTGTVGYPIVFSGTDLPSPVVAGTVYWAKGTAATTFTIYPTAADMIAGTNVIDLTTDGTAGNFTYSYYRSANDHTAIQADFQLCIDAIENNIGVTPRFVAYNQGAVDEYVETAARNCGMLVSRTTHGMVYVFSSYLYDTDLEADIYPHQHICTVQIDEASARTTAYYISHIATAVGLGLCIHTYMHSHSTQTNQNLANFCDALLFYERQGMLDVKTMSEYYDDRSGIRAAASRVASGTRVAAESRVAA
jgi:hypothetical protein